MAPARRASYPPVPALVLANHTANPAKTRLRRYVNAAAIPNRIADTMFRAKSTVRWHERGKAAAGVW
jgi:hypothetical protein